MSAPKFFTFRELTRTGTGLAPADAPGRNMELWE